MSENGNKNEVFVNVSGIYDRERELLKFLGEYGSMDADCLSYFYTAPRYRLKMYYRLKENKMVNMRTHEGSPGSIDEKLLKFSRKKKLNDELRTYFKELKEQLKKEYVKTSESLKKLKVYANMEEVKNDADISKYFEKEIKRAESVLKRLEGSVHYIKFKTVAITKKTSDELTSKGYLARNRNNSADMDGLIRQKSIAEMALKLKSIGYIVTEHERKLLDERTLKLAKKFFQSIDAKRIFGNIDSGSSMYGLLFSPKGIYIMYDMRKGYKAWDLKREAKTFNNTVIRDSDRIVQLNGVIVFVENNEMAERVDKYVADDKTGMYLKYYVLPNNDFGWSLFKIITEIGFDEYFSSLNVTKSGYKFLDYIINGEYVIVCDGDMMKKRIVKSALTIWPREIKSILVLIPEYYGFLYQDMFRALKDNGIECRIEQCFIGEY